MMALSAESLNGSSLGQVLYRPRPRNLSNKLSEFLGVEPDVMQKMKAYVEANNLKDGHSIRLDSALQDLSEHAKVFDPSLYVIENTGSVIA
jgi:hypothetical protein